MDFKVAGSARGITAIQLDIKVKSIDFDLIEAALQQAQEARLRILDRMREAIAEPRADLSPYAPRMVRISIPVDKIGSVIGPGGKTIRGIVEQTGATVDIQDDGSVFIGSADGEASRKAIEMVENLTREAKVGEIYTGKVVKILPSGAFVAILPGQDGLVHISQLANDFVRSVEDVVSLGEEITVMVTGVDPSGRISLSRRALLEADPESEDGQGGPVDLGRPEPSIVPAGGGRGGRPGGPAGGRPEGADRPMGGGYRRPRPGPGRRGGGPRGDSRSGPRPFRGGGPRR
jgi:polyribonucleotide nucleotidyltransferase